ncbi:hypothetical protein [uncultured Draconibacterium sp.]|uniref:hypothetical protein n=1 Tax=uncultured Draconibacterium sp. TaxID=1573823 RepID=UPI0025EC58CF|nr:hypothetical protein [uncultured Draconibacterium sp.]
MSNENQFKELLVNNPEMLRYQSNSLNIYLGLFRNFKEGKYYTFYFGTSDKFASCQFNSHEEVLEHARGMAQLFLDEFNSKYNGNKKKGNTSYAYHLAWSNYCEELEKLIKGGELLQLNLNKLNANKASFKMTQREILDALEEVLFQLECKGMDFLFDFVINEMNPFRYENCNVQTQYHKNLKNVTKVWVYGLTKVWISYENSDKIHFEYPIGLKVITQN